MDASRVKLPSAALAAPNIWPPALPQVQHDEEDHTRPTTPWVRSVISGVDLMRDARVGALSAWLAAFWT